MKITIEHVYNGFILEDGESRQVIEERGEPDLKALQTLLWTVLESIGYYGSKHDAERLFVEIRKQKQ